MPTRRNFISQTTAAAAAAFGLASCNGRKPLFSSKPGASETAPASNRITNLDKKKGLGITMKHGQWDEKLEILNAGWFHTWSHSIPPEIPAGTKFVPMIYRLDAKKQFLADALSTIKEAGITELLGFSEPDQKRQANMTLEECIGSWPLLMEAGLRLGSISCVHPDSAYMRAFMKEVDKKQLGVDFICVHSYGSPNPRAFINSLERTHRAYQRPIWITEFAIGDWDATASKGNRHSAEEVLRFMEDVLPKLEKLDFVERYAWFPTKPTSFALGSSALFDVDGQLTRLGECYRDLA